MKKTCGVYLIQCNVNNKVYIGESVYVECRWSVHKHHLRHNTHRSKSLENDWVLFGEKSFNFVILEETSSVNLFERSQYYMDAFDCTNNDKGYNLEPKAISSIGSKRKPLTQEHKNKCGKAIRLLWNKDPSRFLKNRKPVTEKSKLATSARSRKAWSDPIFRESMYRIKSAYAKTEVGRLHILKANMAAVSARSLYYIVTSPLKKVWLVKNLAKFCREFALKRSSMEDVVSGRVPSCYGWVAKKATHTDIETWSGEKYE